MLEALAVFGGVDHVGRGADDGHARFFQAQRQFERGLSAVLHDDAGGFFLVHDFQHVFKRERLEVEAVGGVVVGGDGFGVAIDHDGLVAVFAHGQRGVHAAVVEFNALADAVGAAAENHDFFAAGGFGLAFFFVGGIQVGRAGGEFGGAGVHALVDGAHAQRVAVRAHGVLIRVQELGQAPVGKAFLLEGAHGGGVQRGEGGLAFFGHEAVDVQLDAHDLLDLHEEPFVDFGELVHFVQRPAGGEGVAHEPDALRAGFAQLFFQRFAVFGFFVHAVHAHFQAAQGFLERLLEGAANGHDFAHAFHLRGQVAVGLREFLEGKARDFGDDVVNRRLEAGGRGAAGDFVFQLVQGVADGETRGDRGNWEAGRL